MTLEEYKEQLAARLRELTNARAQTVKSVSVLDGAIAECQMQMQAAAEIQVPESAPPPEGADPGEEVESKGGSA